MKENLNQEVVYVLNQPKHIILSVVVVDCQVPLKTSIHNDLDKLIRYSDVIFIFCNDKFSSNKKIDKRKFTSLYQACGFIESSGNLAKTLFTVLEYSKEIFKKHIGITISNLDNIDITDIQIKNLIEINGSAIMKPVFKIRRLESNELFEIYERDIESEEIEAKFKITTSILNFIDRKNKIITEDNYGMFKCYTSDSKLLYFKNGTINLILNFVNNPESTNYINSFENELDIRSVLSSIIKKLGIDNLNQNIEDLEINNLRPANKTTTIKRKNNEKV